MGVSKYKSRREVWLSKRGLLQDKDLSGSPHVARGVYLEPMVEQYIREHIDPTINSRENWTKHDKTGNKPVIKSSQMPQIMLLSGDHPLTGKPYAGGHPDGIGDAVLHEIKCPGSVSLGLIYREGVPVEWLYQVAHYQWLAGVEKGMLHIWSCDGWAPHTVEVDVEAGLGELLESEYIDFWTHVQNGTEPTDATEAQDHQFFLHAHEQMADILSDYHKYQTMAREASAGKDDARLRLLTYAGTRETILTMGHHAKLSHGKTKAGAKTVRVTVSENAEYKPDA